MFNLKIGESSLIYNVTIINHNKHTVEMLVSSAGLCSAYLCTQAGFGRNPAGLLSSKTEDVFTLQVFPNFTPVLPS